MRQSKLHVKPRRKPKQQQPRQVERQSKPLPKPKRPQKKRSKLNLPTSSPEPISGCGYATARLLTASPATCFAPTIANPRHSAINISVMTGPAKKYRYETTATPK